MCRQILNPKNTKILIVDDDKNSFKVLEAILIKFGFISELILHAKNGKIGLEIIEKKGNFDIVFTDCMMPVMNGLELIGNIRKYENVNLFYPKNVPIIFASNETQDDVFLEANYLGANAFIQKPFSHIAIKAVLENYVKFPD